MVAGGSFERSPVQRSSEPTISVISDVSDPPPPHFINNVALPNHSRSLSAREYMSEVGTSLTSLTSLTSPTGVRQSGGGGIPFRLWCVGLSVDRLAFSVDLPEPILGTAVSHDDVAAFFEPVWDQS
jgi:hypothetical protein